ncbi:protein kinase 2B, chloroplastic-like [Dorcoceras hygrometricum]|uniref:Protein kinase 2B, chloroplastic-like n=1 Tax=Dorcoceras hygrometricum TaxID=472368 RepID=A0A2Z7CE71_9LAMI|nr:protein kinase 2B, chloroplastic-like [Dorcoceras hygrometricum]
MSRVYDNWERLVEATLKRERLRQVALCHSFSSSSVSTETSFDSALQDASALSTSSNSFGPVVRSIAFEELKKATGNFRRDLCLGEGTYSVIYKGRIQESTFTAAKGFMRSVSPFGMAVAVKKWKCQTKLGLVSWYLSQLDHPNIVKLLGYCLERDNMVLVYEYMPKRSLKNHLFRVKRQALSWNTRIKVAMDAARGLSFLHDRDIPVIHGDFHIDHILLDGKFSAKLCGFGLAKDGDVSCDSTRVQGTSGMLAPELFVMTGRLTTKCDVFAFGVVLLEILSGRPVMYLIAAIEADGPVDWVTIYMNDNTKLLGVLYSRLKGQCTQYEARRAVILGLQCLNSNPELRPRMADILAVLQQFSGPNNDKQIKY